MTKHRPAMTFFKQKRRYPVSLS